MHEEVYARKSDGCVSIRHAAPATLHMDICVTRSDGCIGKSTRGSQTDASVYGMQLRPHYICTACNCGVYYMQLYVLMFRNEVMV
jgi:hypothetical protein